MFTLQQFKAIVSQNSPKNQEENKSYSSISVADLRVIWLTQILAHLTSDSFSICSSRQACQPSHCVFLRFIPKPKASFNHFMTDMEPLQGAKDGATHIVLFCVVSWASQPRNQGQLYQLQQNNTLAHVHEGNMSILQVRKQDEDCSQMTGQGETCFGAPPVRLTAQQ